MDPQQTQQPQPVSNQPAPPPLSTNPPPTPKPRLPLLLGGLIISLSILGGSYYLFSAKETIQLEPLPSPIISQQPPTAIPVIDPTANWIVYSNKEGVYGIKFPPMYEILENQRVSVDGIKTESENTVTIVSNNEVNAESSFILSINHQLNPSNLALKEIVDSNNWCSSITSNNAKPYILGETEAFIFESNACGPFGSTVIYSTHNGLTYLIKIESQTSYENIRNSVNQILSTFTFLEQNQISPTIALDETGNWNIYTNTKYNYSLKYPDGWFLYDKGILNPTTNEFTRQQEIVIISPTSINDLYPGGFSIKNSILIQGDLGALIKEGISTNTYQVSETKFNQLDTIKTVTIGKEIMGDPTTNYFFTNNNINFQVSHTNDDFNGTHNPVFDQILSSFKFLE